MSLEETERDLFWPLNQNDLESVKQSEEQHVQAAIRLFAQQALTERLATIREKIRTIDRKTEGIRQRRHPVPHSSDPESEEPRREIVSKSF